MENANASEELVEWEHIQIQPGQSTTQWEDEDEFVVIKDANFSDHSIFPPSNHEDLPITTNQEDIYNLQEPPPPETPSPLPSAAAITRRWGAVWEAMNSGIFRVAYKVRFCAVCAAGFWRVGMAATAGLGLAFLYWRAKPWRRWWRRPVGRENIKDHWMLLIREKDQKINQLLLQIAQMKEILSASQRVPVLRVR